MAIDPNTVIHYQDLLYGHPEDHALLLGVLRLHQNSTNASIYVGERGADAQIVCSNHYAWWMAYIIQYWNTWRVTRLSTHSDHVWRAFQHLRTRIVADDDGKTVLVLSVQSIRGRYAGWSFGRDELEMMRRNAAAVVLRSELTRPNGLGRLDCDWIDARQLHTTAASILPTLSIDSSTRSLDEINQITRMPMRISRSKQSDISPYDAKWVLDWRAWSKTPSGDVAGTLQLVVDTIEMLGHRLQLASAGDVSIRARIQLSYAEEACACQLVLDESLSHGLSTSLEECEVAFLFPQHSQL